MANHKLLLVLLMAGAVSLVTSKSMWKRSDDDDDLFDEVDTNGDGFVSKEELEAYLPNVITAEEGLNFGIIAQDFVTDVDAGDNPDGKLDHDEFQNLAFVQMDQD